MEMTVDKFAKATREGFAEELAFIKASEQRKKLSDEDTHRTIKNLAIGAGAYGLGSATSAAMRRGVLPKILPALPKRHRAALGTASGLLTAGSALALTQAMRRRKEKLERD